MFISGSFCCPVERDLFLQPPISGTNAPQRLFLLDVVQIPLSHAQSLLWGHASLSFLSISSCLQNYSNTLCYFFVVPESDIKEYRLDPSFPQSRGNRDRHWGAFVPCRHCRKRAWHPRGCWLRQRDRAA